MGLTIVLFTLHELEEFATGFVLIDPWTQTVASALTLPPEFVFWVIQLVGFTFLIWVFVTRPTAAWPYWLIGVIMIAELDHVIRAIAIHTYYPGLVTAILILLFAITYCRGLFSSTE